MAKLNALFEINTNRKWVIGRAVVLIHYRRHRHASFCRPVEIFRSACRLPCTRVLNHYSKSSHSPFLALKNFTRRHIAATFLIFRSINESNVSIHVWVWDNWCYLLFKHSFLHNVRGASADWLQIIKRVYFKWHTLLIFSRWQSHS